MKSRLYKYNASKFFGRLCFPSYNELTKAGDCDTLKKNAQVCANKIQNNCGGDDDKQRKV